MISLIPPGPGLSIRVICAEEAFICKDFAETNNMLKIITDFSASVKKVGISGWKGRVDANTESPHAKRSEWNVHKLHDRHSN